MLHGLAEHGVGELLSRRLGLDAGGGRAVGQGDYCQVKYKTQCKGVKNKRGRYD